MKIILQIILMAGLAFSCSDEPTGAKSNTTDLTNCEENPTHEDCIVKEEPVVVDPIDYAYDKFLNPQEKIDCNESNKVFDWTLNDGEGLCTQAVLDETLCDEAQAVAAFGNVQNSEGLTPQEIIDDWQSKDYEIDDKGCGSYSTGDGEILIMIKSENDNGTYTLDAERICTGSSDECNNI